MPIIDIHGHYGAMPYAVEPQSIDEVLTLMKMFGIERTFLASAVAITVDMEAGNQQLAEAITAHDGLFGYVVLNPNGPEESAEEMRKYLGNRQFVGGKLHRTRNGQPLDSPECMQIIKGLLRYDKPVLVHADGAESLHELEALAKAYPTCPFILANMGDEHWPEALRIAKRVTNLHLDVGGAVADADRIKRAADQVGVHRLVFGTGTPLVHPLFALGMVRDAQVPASDKDRILYRNALKLFKLG